VDPLPGRVRLVAAPGELRGLELEVRGWTTDEQSGEIALVCRLVDGSVGEIPARWTDLPARVKTPPAVGGFGSPRRGGCCWRAASAWKSGGGPTGRVEEGPGGERLLAGVERAGRARAAGGRRAACALAGEDRRVGGLRG
jgi:hypothetical protein